MIMEHKIDGNYYLGFTDLKFRALSLKGLGLGYDM